MYQVIIIVHVLLGLGVVGFVLLQQGKGADAGAAFGSGSSGSVFGAQGSSSFLSRTTAILAALFFSTSLGLAVLSGHQDGPVDLMETTEAEEVFADLPLVNDTDSAPIKATPMSLKDVKAGSFVPDTVSDAVQGATEQAGGLADAVGNKVGGIVEGANNIVSEGIDNIGNQAGSLVDGAKNVVSDNMSSLDNKAGEIVGGAKNIVTDSMGTVENKANVIIEETGGIISEKIDMIKE
jgi:preprotein translocase subunit SecG